MCLGPMALWHGVVGTTYGFKIPNPYCARVGTLGTLALAPSPQTLTRRCAWVSAWRVGGEG